MKFQKMLLVLLVMFSLTFAAVEARAQTRQSVKQYEDMSRAERLTFVGEQARRIARQMSGTEYQFTADFERDIQRVVTQYAQRTGTGERARTKSDLRFVFERGQAHAPLVIAVFKARNISPLIGLYLSWIESEFDNIQPDNPTAAVGVFQLLPATGERYGLTPEELLDVGKSADAAARYIADSLQTFNADPMKEALALLAYNRGGQRVTRDLKLLINEQNRVCSICALTSDRSKRDETFTPESVFYVPRFFAAAIIGENPEVFGLKMQPLSSQ